MKAFSFSSIQEVVNYIDKDKEKGYIIHAPIEHVVPLSQQVGDNVVICSTAGEYTTAGYKNGVITGFEYDLSEGTVIEILYPPVKSHEPLKHAYEKVKHNKNAFLLLLCDGLSGVEESIITTLYFMDKDFKIIGGSAGDSCQFKETLIYIGSRKVHSVAVFFNSKRRTELIKENIYVPNGKQMLVTDADPTERIVRTFNNAPASSEYAKMLGISEQELPDYFRNNPLGKIYNDDIYIASPMKVNPDKSITFYCQVMPNTFINVLKPIDPVNKVRDTIKAMPFTPKFAYVINCILRSLKYNEEGLWEKVDKELLQVCKNTTGFISYGEQFYKHHVNQTMVMLIIE